MVMFLRSKTLLVLAAGLLLGATAIETSAGEHAMRHRHAIRHLNIRTNVHVTQNRVTVNIDRNRRHHRLHRNVNTYSGDVAIYYRRGVGTWSYGSFDAPESTLTLHPSAKIIDLTSGRNDCSMEKGVCVIRP
jgi:hypothetical protein